MQLYSQNKLTEAANVFTQAHRCIGGMRLNFRMSNEYKWTPLVAKMGLQAAKCFIEVEKYPEARQWTADVFQLSKDQAELMYLRSRASMLMGRFVDARSDAIYAC